MASQRTAVACAMIRSSNGRGVSNSYHLVSRHADNLWPQGDRMPHGRRTARSSWYPLSSRLVSISRTAPSNATCWAIPLCQAVTHRRIAQGIWSRTVAESTFTSLKTPSPCREFSPTSEHSLRNKPDDLFHLHRNIPAKSCRSRTSQSHKTPRRPRAQG